MLSTSDEKSTERDEKAAKTVKRSTISHVRMSNSKYLREALPGVSLIIILDFGQRQVALE